MGQEGKNRSLFVKDGKDGVKYHKMNQDISNTKELVINAILYAHYIIEDGTLFIKLRKNIIKDSYGKSEDLMVQIISLIERKRVEYVAHLNIK